MLQLLEVRSFAVTLCPLNVRLVVSDATTAGCAISPVTTGCFLGLNPPQTNSKTPKLNYEALSIGRVLIKYQNVKPP